MTRFPGCAPVVLSLVLSSHAFGQTTTISPPAGPRPAMPTGPPGAPRPGMPPRSTGAEAPQTGTATLRGRVVALQTGSPLRRAQVSISLMDGRPLRRTTTTDAEGRYEFLELPAGRLSVNVTKAGYVSLQYGQRRPFEAGTPVNVADGETVERIDFSLPGGPFDPLANGTIAEDGTFKLAGASGRVFFGLTPLPAWVLKSVSLDGEDITDVPFDLSGRTTVSDLRIVVTDKLTTISGQVTDGAGRAAKDYVVVIQPAEPKEPIVASRWIRLVRPDINGRFETRGMRPGRYVATAVDALEQGQQFAPDVQARLRSAGRTFEIEEGASATVALELTDGF